MPLQATFDEYIQAMRQGQRERTERVQAGLDPNPAVLDAIHPDTSADVVQDLGILEIPSERIIGTKSAGRIAAFSPSFRPVLDPKSEFALKWVTLCEAHLGSTGIRDPIECYEYLGNFYVQEGNKRVSVLRHFGAPRIPASVKRIVPPLTDEPRIRAYYEFLDFFKVSKLYTVQYRRPADYAKLLGYLGKKAGEVWTEAERRTFNAYFLYFREAFDSLNLQNADILPEEALLLWLELYPYSDLGTLTAPELKKTVAAMREDILSASRPDALKVQTKMEEDPKPGILTRIISPTPDHLNVAFVHQLTPAISDWVLDHEKGAEHLESVFGAKLTIRSYYNADTQEAARELISRAAEDGAQVVFTTAPLLRRATLKAAVEFPKVQFLNCSVDQPYSSVRSYYARVYEAKFITGAIAGAMAQDDRIGFIASYPIFGIPASINAFALGAQLTNPRAQIELRWSCLEGNPREDLYADGIRVISNRDTPVQSRRHLDFCSYGTFQMNDRGNLISLASPVWVWGKFYEAVVGKMLAGSWKIEKSNPKNYWLGMDSGVIDLNLSDQLPEGVRVMAKLLKRAIVTGAVNPFLRKVVAQDGSVKNDGSSAFTPDEILHMDWLCANVIGSIPSYQKILPMSQPMVRELGVYRDSIPMEEKEGKSLENFDSIR